MGRSRTINKRNEKIRTRQSLPIEQGKGLLYSSIKSHFCQLNSNKLYGRPRLYNSHIKALKLKLVKNFLSLFEVSVF